MQPLVLGYTHGHGQLTAPAIGVPLRDRGIKLQVTTPISFQISWKMKKLTKLNETNFITECYACKF